MTPPVWGEPVDGLRLGIGAGDGWVALCLGNIGDAPLTVLSHVMAPDEAHLDWFAVTLAGEETDVLLRLFDDRNRAAEITVDLPPGSELAHRVDLMAWATRPINGPVTLAPGTYRATATYEVPPNGAAWTGTIHSGTTTVTVRP
ncbi:hypothetical protein K1W54_16440 [Micromonospora sp. CPCC 205371]|nr:hypothetical protein [Micromonospora sp. CPCC 205371]